MFPYPNHTRKKLFFRKWRVLFVAVIVPEWVAIFALDQWSNARASARSMRLHDVRRILFVVVNVERLSRNKVV